MEEPHQYEFSPYEVIGEDTLNIDSMDYEEEVKARGGDDRVIGPSDIEAKLVKKEKFGARSILSQSAMNKLAKKYNISNIYLFRALEEGKLISNLKLCEIVVYITHLESGLGFSLVKFFTEFLLYTTCQLVPNY